MIAIAKKLCPSRNPDWHRQFLEMLPSIERDASIAFRKLPAEQREDAIREVVASSFCAFHRLVQLGKQDLAYAGVLAKFAVAQYRSGRRVGTRINSSDVLSLTARRRHDPHKHSVLRSRGSENWLESLTDNDCTSIPEQVSFRVDFPSWLAKLDPRNRKLAKFLMVGNTAVATARQFELSAGRVSQIRDELRKSWIAFHGKLLQPWEAVTFGRTGK